MQGTQTRMADTSMGAAAGGALSASHPIDPASSTSTSTSIVTQQQQQQPTTGPTMDRRSVLTRKRTLLLVAYVLGRTSPARLVQAARQTSSIDAIAVLGTPHNLLCALDKVLGPVHVDGPLSLSSAAAAGTVESLLEYGVSQELYTNDVTSASYNTNKTTSSNYNNNHNNNNNVVGRTASLLLAALGIGSTFQTGATGGTGITTETKAATEVDIYDFLKDTERYYHAKYIADAADKAVASLSGTTSVGERPLEWYRQFVAYNGCPGTDLLGADDGLELIHRNRSIMAVDGSRKRSRTAAFPGGVNGSGTSLSGMAMDGLAGTQSLLRTVEAIHSVCKLSVMCGLATYYIYKTYFDSRKEGNPIRKRDDMRRTRSSPSIGEAAHLSTIDTTDEDSSRIQLSIHHKSRIRRRNRSRTRPGFINFSEKSSLPSLSSSPEGGTFVSLSAAESCSSLPSLALMSPLDGEHYESDCRTGCNGQTSSQMDSNKPCLQIGNQHQSYNLGNNHSLSCRETMESNEEILEKAFSSTDLLKPESKKRKTTYTQNQIQELEDSKLEALHSNESSNQQQHDDGNDDEISPIENCENLEPHLIKSTYLSHTSNGTRDDLDDVDGDTNSWIQFTRIQNNEDGSISINNSFNEMNPQNQYYREETMDDEEEENDIMNGEEFKQLQKELKLQFLQDMNLDDDINNNNNNSMMMLIDSNHNIDDADNSIDFIGHRPPTNGPLGFNDGREISGIWVNGPRLLSFDNNKISNLEFNENNKKSKVKDFMDMGSRNDINIRGSNNGNLSSNHRTRLMHLSSGMGLLNNASGSSNFGDIELPDDIVIRTESQFLFDELTKAVVPMATTLEDHAFVAREDKSSYHHSHSHSHNHNKGDNNNNNFNDQFLTDNVEISTILNFLNEETKQFAGTSEGREGVTDGSDDAMQLAEEQGYQSLDPKPRSPSTTHYSPHTVIDSEQRNLKAEKSPESQNLDTSSATQKRGKKTNVNINVGDKGISNRAEAKIERTKKEFDSIGAVPICVRGRVNGGADPAYQREGGPNFNAERAVFDDCEQLRSCSSHTCLQEANVSNTSSSSLSLSSSLSSPQTSVPVGCDHQDKCHHSKGDNKDGCLCMSLVSGNEITSEKTHDPAGLQMSSHGSPQNSDIIGGGSMRSHLHLARVGVTTPSTGIKTEGPGARNPDGETVGCMNDGDDDDDDVLLQTHAAETAKKHTQPTDTPTTGSIAGDFLIGDNNNNNHCQLLNSSSPCKNVNSRTGSEEVSAAGSQRHKISSRGEDRLVSSPPATPLSEHRYQQGIVLGSSNSKLSKTSTSSTSGVTTSGVEPVVKSGDPLNQMISPLRTATALNAMGYGPTESAFPFADVDLPGSDKIVIVANNLLLWNASPDPEKPVIAFSQDTNEILNRLFNVFSGSEMRRIIILVEIISVNERDAVINLFNSKFQHIFYEFYDNYGVDFLKDNLIFYEKEYLNDSLAPTTSIERRPQEYHTIPVSSSTKLKILSQIRPHYLIDANLVTTKLTTLAHTMGGGLDIVVDTTRSTAPPGDSYEDFLPVFEGGEVIESSDEEYDNSDDSDEETNVDGNEDNGDDFMNDSDMDSDTRAELLRRVKGHPSTSSIPIKHKKSKRKNKNSTDNGSSNSNNNQNNQNNPFVDKDMKIENGNLDGDEISINSQQTRISSPPPPAPPPPSLLILDKTSLMNAASKNGSHRSITKGSEHKDETNSNINGNVHDMELESGIINSLLVKEGNDETETGKKGKKKRPKREGATILSKDQLFINFELINAISKVVGRIVCIDKLAAITTKMNIVQKLKLENELKENIRKKTEFEKYHPFSSIFDEDESDLDNSDEAGTEDEEESVGEEIQQQKSKSNLTKEALNTINNDINDKDCKKGKKISNRSTSDTKKNNRRKSSKWTIGEDTDNESLSNRKIKNGEVNVGYDNDEDDDEEEENYLRILLRRHTKKEPEIDGLKSIDDQPVRQLKRTKSQASKLFNFQNHRSENVVMNNEEFMADSSSNLAQQLEPKLSSDNQESAPSNEGFNHNNKFEEYDNEEEEDEESFVNKKLKRTDTFNKSPTDTSIVPSTETKTSLSDSNSSITIPNNVKFYDNGLDDKLLKRIHSHMTQI